ncbi:MAG: alpha/beta fold hydrolase, partial [Bacteroidetes bacterium]|nr:alpha/beta fold hydrolase [Bacteroidota bacterium]
MDLYYQEYGSNGHPMIILHGLLGSLDNWHSLAGVLAESHHVFTLDQRNHGRSPHFGEMNYRVMADDVRRFMEEENLEKIDLIGHSMGGKVAMH